MKLFLLCCNNKRPKGTDFGICLPYQHTKNVLLAKLLIFCKVEFNLFSIKVYWPNIKVQSFGVYYSQFDHITISKNFCLYFRLAGMDLLSLQQRSSVEGWIPHFCLSRRCKPFDNNQQITRTTEIHPRFVI